MHAASALIGSPLASLNRTRSTSNKIGHRSSSFVGIAAVVISCCCCCFLIFVSSLSRWSKQGQKASKAPEGARDPGGELVLF